MPETVAAVAGTGRGPWITGSPIAILAKTPPMPTNGEPRVAVAGATGNAGREIVRALLDRGCRVRALVRSPDKLGDLRDRIETVEVQVTQPASLRGCMDGVDFAVSAIGKTYQKEKIDRRIVDVQANVNLYDEAKSAGVRRFCLTSVAMARVGHPVAMMAMKGEAEAALEQSGLDWVIIQPSGYFSDLWAVFQMCARGTLWTVGAGDVKLNPISTIDLGDFIAAAVLDDAYVGKRLPIGGPEVMDSHGVADRAERVLGRTVKRRSIPMWLARAGVAIVRPFSRNAYELGDFFVGQMAWATRHLDGDASVPVFGTHRLEDYFRERWAEGGS